MGEGFLAEQQEGVEVAGGGGEEGVCELGGVARGRAGGGGGGGRGGVGGLQQQLQEGGGAGGEGRQALQGGRGGAALGPAETGPRW